MTHAWLEAASSGPTKEVVRNHLQLIGNMLCGICDFDFPYPDIFRDEGFVLDPGIDYQGSAIGDSRATQEAGSSYQGPAIGDSRATQEAGSSGGASGSSRRLEFNMFAGAPGLELPVEVSQPSDSFQAEEVEAQSSLAVGSRDPEPANEDTVESLLRDWGG